MENCRIEGNNGDNYRLFVKVNYYADIISISVPQFENGISVSDLKFYYVPNALIKKLGVLVFEWKIAENKGQLDQYKLD